MSITTTLESYITWFKAHERLVLLLATGFFAVHFYGKGLDFLIKHDQTQAQIATVQAQAAAGKVTVDDTANKLLLVQLQTLQQQNQATNLRLDQIMRDRATATANQKQIDDKSDSAALAARIHALLGVGTVQVEPQGANLPDHLSYSLDAAHADADNLEDLQQAKLDVKDLNTKLDGCKTITDKQADTITGLNTQIADGKSALVAEQKSHVDDVKLEKAKAKRAWLRGFKWGAITGFVGGLFVSHYL
jgi:hypothetical protein